MQSIVAYLLPLLWTCVPVRVMHRISRMYVCVCVYMPVATSLSEWLVSVVASLLVWAPFFGLGIPAKVFGLLISTFFFLWMAFSPLWIRNYPRCPKAFKWFRIVSLRWPGVKKHTCTHTCTPTCTLHQFYVSLLRASREKSACSQLVVYSWDKFLFSI